MRQRATNHARTNECDLVTRHFAVSFATKIRRATRGGGIAQCRHRIDSKAKNGKRLFLVKEFQSFR
jgi:hypothetical protein